MRFVAPSRWPAGHVLCFLPGAPEIRRAQAELAGRTGDARVLPLHGRLGAEEQDEALAPSSARKVILATNVAETSLTVEGVTDVIDTGQQKVLRFDPATGLDRLVLERISLDSAEQRRGRAGRTGPGRVVRLWDARDRLRARREPEIERVDLASPALDVLAWGGDPRTFEWFEAPPEDRLAAALGLLERLGATREGRITRTGEAMHRLPLHPRLARVMVDAGGGARAAAVCAVLAEGWRPAGDPPTTDSDVLSAADRIRDAPPGVRAAARDVEDAARAAGVGRARVGEGDEALRRALLAGFPDRVARRREPLSNRLVLATGQGAVLGRESGVRGGDLLLALDVTGGAAGAGGEPIVRAASRVEREWLAGVRTEVVHRFDDEAGAVRAFARDEYEGLLLAERPVPVDPALAAELLAQALERRGLGPAAAALQGRLRAAGLEADLHAGVVAACRGRTSLPALDRPERVARPRRARAPRPPRARAAGAAERSHRRARVPRRRRGRCRGEAAGAVRPRRHASHRAAAGARRLRAARAERTAGPDDERPAQLLGAHVPGGPQGAARPLPAPPVARGPVERRADPPREETAMMAVIRRGGGKALSSRIARPHGPS